MRKVRDTEKNLTQFVLNVVGLGAQCMLLGSELPTLGLSRLGGRLVTRTLGQTDCLRQLVDLGADVVAPSRDLAGLDVESDRHVELFEQFRFVATGE